MNRRLKQWIGNNALLLVLSVVSTPMLMLFGALSAFFYDNPKLWGLWIGCTIVSGLFALGSSIMLITEALEELTRG